jgi:predicted CoA-binding protein
VTDIDGIPVYRSLADLPEPVQSLSIVTPPAVTAKVVAEAIEHGVQSIWMQPGAENEEAIIAARESGIDVIAGGPCVLVALIQV